MEADLVVPYMFLMDQSMPFSDVPQPADAATERRRARHERRVERLAEVSEIGFEMAHVIRKQCEEAKWLGADGPLMLERILMSVRRTTALEAHLDEDFDERERRLAARPLPRVRAASGPAAKAAGATPEPVVAGSQMAETGGIARPAEDPVERDTDPRDLERLLCDLHERLEDPLVGLRLGNGRSLVAIVGEICARLGIKMDLRLFGDDEEAAEEAMKDTAIRPDVVPPLQPPPKEPVIKTGRLGVISVDGVVLGAAEPGLPGSAFKSGRGPP
jgi:hypothetical protein